MPREGTSGALSAPAVPREGTSGVLEKAALFQEAPRQVRCTEGELAAYSQSSSPRVRCS